MESGKRQLKLPSNCAVEGKKKKNKTDQNLFFHLRNPVNSLFSFCSTPTNSHILTSIFRGTMRYLPAWDSAKHGRTTVLVRVKMVCNVSLTCIVLGRHRLPFFRQPLCVTTTMLPSRDSCTCNTLAPSLTSIFTVLCDTECTTSNTLWRNA